MSTWLPDARGAALTARNLLLAGDWRGALRCVKRLTGAGEDVMYKDTLIGAARSMSDQPSYRPPYSAPDYLQHMIGWASHWLYHNAPKAALATLRRYHLLAQQYAHHAHDDEAFALELEARSLLARQESP